MNKVGFYQAFQKTEAKFWSSALLNDKNAILPDSGKMYKSFGT